jgi:hypothetical protein
VRKSIDGTSETSVDNDFTRQYIPEDNSEHHTRRRENLKSHNPKVHHRTHNSPLPAPILSHPLSLAYTSLTPFLPFSKNLTWPKSHVHFPVLRLCHVIRPVPRLCVVIRNKYWVLRGRVVSPPPNPQAAGPSTVGCPRLLIQYIRSYPPYLEAVSSIHNPRTRHAVVTVDPLNMGELGKRRGKTVSIVKSNGNRWYSDIFPETTARKVNIIDALSVVMKISRKNLNRKIFPFFIRTVDMVSLCTFYTVIIMLI